MPAAPRSGGPRPFSSLARARVIHSVKKGHFLSPALSRSVVVIGHEKAQLACLLGLETEDDQALERFFIANFIGRRVGAVLAMDFLAGDGRREDTSQVHGLGGA